MAIRGRLRAWLILQWNDRTAVAAEGGDALQGSVGAGDGHDRAVAVNGVAGGGKIPAPALGVLGHGRGRLPLGFLWREREHRQTKQQG